jgi:hypothetical protein
MKKPNKPRDPLAAILLNGRPSAVKTKLHSVRSTNKSRYLGHIVICVLHLLFLITM